MDRPPGGWSDLVTTPVLDARFAAVDARFDGFEARLDALESRLMAEIEKRFRIQTAWLVVALGVFAGILKV